ncbi:MAG: GTPase Era [Clostridia bacterium]|nr:GTPase Era [Clostridia bacterium]
MIKCGYVGVIGRANAGKSSLVNRLVGERVAIVSSKPQTTRNNILGILNGENYQIILVDTPGIHHSKNNLDRYMMKNVRNAISSVDVLLYLIDGSKELDQEEIDYINMLKEKELNVIYLQTKCDKKQKIDMENFLKISSITGENIDKVIESIVDSLPECSTRIYDEDLFTDKSIKFLIEEDIRGQALNMFDKEVPHGIAIETERFDEKNDIVIIEANIICERDSHKGIIIGKGGKNLKIIGQKSREYAEELLDKQVLLKLFVKVDKDWRDRNYSNYGYKF